MSDLITPTWTLGDRLAKAREHAGIGVQQMAELLGVSRTTITNYEHGHTPAGRAVVLAYASITGVASSWIDDNDDDPSTNTLDRRASRWIHAPLIAA